jgi:hypothetical protein
MVLNNYLKNISLKGTKLLSARGAHMTRCNPKAHAWNLNNKYKKKEME